MSEDRAKTEVTALAQQVETARGKISLQHDTALYSALSDAEIAAERELAEWIRAQRRKQRKQAVTDELAADRRDRRVGTALRRADEADARWHRRALAARRRVSSADARVAQLYRRSEWSSRALIGVVVLGMVWAGVNVQHNLVPSGDMRDPLYWLSFGIEAMISIPIIVIMITATTAARWGRELDRGKVFFFEAALLGTTVALNTGPHLASGDLGRAAEFAIAPVMVGVVIWLHAWVSARYAMLIDAAMVEVPADRGVIAEVGAPIRRMPTEIGPERDEFTPLGAMQAGSVDAASTTDMSMPAVTASARGADDAIAAVIAESGSGITTLTTVTAEMPPAGARATSAAAEMAPADAGSAPAAEMTSVAAESAHDTAEPMSVTTEATYGPLSSTIAAGSGRLTAEPISAAAANAPVTTESDSTTVELGSTTATQTPVAAEPTPGTAESTSTVTAAAPLTADARPAAAATPTVAATTTSPVAASPIGSTVTDEQNRVASRGTVPAPAPGTVELIHKAAQAHRRNGAHIGHAEPVSALRRIPVLTPAHVTDDEPVGAEPVPEATAHAGSAARDHNGDTSSAAVETPAPTPTADEPTTVPAPAPEQLTLPTEPETEVPTDTARADEPAAATGAESDNDENELTADEFDEEGEVRALARQIAATRNPLRLTLDQIEQILELTNESWTAPSIGAEIGVSGRAVTNVIELAQRMTRPYAYTG